MKSKWIMFWSYVLTIPNRCFLGLFSYFLWIKPYYTSVHHKNSSKYNDLTTSQLQTMIKSKLTNLQLKNELEFTLREFKYLGMMDFIKYKETDKYFDQLMKIFTLQGNLNPVCIHDKFDFNDLSGVMIAIVNRLNTKTLKQEYRDKLILFWNKCTFDSPLMEIKYTNKNDETIKMFNPFTASKLNSILFLLTWLEVGFRLTDDVRYRQMYKRYRLFSVPLMWLKVTDNSFNILVKDKINWKSIHDDTLYCLAGYLSNEDVYYQDYIKTLIQKYNCNIDVLVILKTYFDVEVDTDTDKYILLNINDCRYKGQYRPGIIGFRYIQNPITLQFKYIWENDLTETKFDKVYTSEKDYLDSLFPFSIYERE